MYRIFLVFFTIILVLNVFMLYWMHVLEAHLALSDSESINREIQMRKLSKIVWKQNIDILRGPSHFMEIHL